MFVIKEIYKASITYILFYIFVFLPAIFIVNNFDVIIPEGQENAFLVFNLFILFVFATHYTKIIVRAIEKKRGNKK